MAQLYNHSLMLSIAIYNAPFSLIVPFSHSKPLRKALTGAFRLNLTLQVTQLALGTTNVHNVLLLQAELTGIETKAPNPLQHFSEHSPAHHHLSKLTESSPHENVFQRCAQCVR